MNKKNDGMVALVTGASSGIGEATVNRLLRRGFTVYAGARRVERMEGLRAAGAKILALDVTDDASMTGAVDMIVKAEGRLDVLVNNAGYGSFGALEDVPLSEGRYQFDVNVFGLARMTQLVLPWMRKQKGGYIFNISSIGGKISEPCGSWYHSTKFAVEGMSDCLRLELRDFGVKVVLIEPGPTASEWDGIAREKLLKVSGDTAYGAVAGGVASFLEQSYRFASPADSAAKKIEKALAARRPRSRYPSGRGAAFILFFRRMLSDRVYDAVMARLMR